MNGGRKEGGKDGEGGRGWERMEGEKVGRSDPVFH